MVAEEMSKIKAIVLFSGGLDSILAAKIALLQGWEVRGLFLDSVFYQERVRKDAYKAAETLGLGLEIIDISPLQYEAVKNPRFGWGRNLNPCLDCRIIMFRKAKQYLEKEKGDILVSGEVAGERPFSQRRQSMRQIEKAAGIEGILLRPLSHSCSSLSLEKVKFSLNRELLFDIRGRSRSKQMELAKKWAIFNYPSPAGGCLLTDAQFCRRLKDYLARYSDFDINILKLLKLGRHFSLSSETKLIVGRHKEDNAAIKELARDTYLQFFPLSCRGPFAVGIGRFEEENLHLALRIVARYTDKEAVSVEVVVVRPQGRFSYRVSPLEDEVICRLRI